ncbi:MAG: type III pantothenate kinase [Bacteroidales bacterium]|nr:type III pantothenate kinase [Bacteroidales bacterium]
MNLIIDSGNTSCKFAVYDGNRLIYSDMTKADSTAAAAAVRKIRGEYHIINSIFSSVSIEGASVSEELRDIPGVAMELTPDTRIPIVNRYSTPKTLGNDRLAAAVGATVMFPGGNSLIIDVGTAITYDYVKDGCEYLGGNISPGIDIRLRALHDYTSRLPLIDDPQPTETFGLSTREAISNGVVMGVIHEIEGYVSDFEKKNVNSNIILTGGGSIYLSKKLKITIFAEPNLVNIGLNRILNYNVLKEN